MFDALMASYTKPIPSPFNIFTTNAAMQTADITQPVKDRINSFFDERLLLDKRMKTMTRNINVICKKLSENQWMFESIEKKLYDDHFFHIKRGFDF